MNTLCHCVARFPERSGIALRTHVDDHWRDISWQEYFELIVKAAAALKQLGVKPKTKVALMSNTRYEWSVLDHAVMGLGAQLVPIYQTVTPEELEFVLCDSDSKILIVENKSLFRTYSSIKDHCPEITALISIEEIDKAETSAISFKELLTMGDISFADEFKRQCLEITPNDIATIVYTSGTTGSPKGVVLTHDSAYCEVSEAFPSCGVNTQDISLTFLPYAHILGRIEHWGHAYIGFTLVFAESIESVRNNLVEIRPTFLVAVPRIFEKIYAAVQTQLEVSPLKKVFLGQALAIGRIVSQHRIQGTSIPLSVAIQYEIAKKIVLSKVKEAFGGRLRFAMSGGAPLSQDISLFFHASDVLILEGYGLTETTGAITVNTPYDYKFGSVGKPVGEAKIKIAEDGEILIKSRKVMKQYYKNPEATAEVFTDGWFHTGDIGELSKAGDLTITDRKKDLIKTAGGKYIAPQKLEGLLKLHPIISNVLIHGDKQKFVVALVTLDKDYLLKFAQQHSVSYPDYETLTQSKPVLEAVRKAVAETNSQLASYESIKRFKVLGTDFTIESGELTPSLKVKRKILDQKYSKEIQQLYKT
jgi:long-chain acyl-CoA synthetase